MAYRVKRADGTWSDPQDSAGNKITQADPAAGASPSTPPVPDPPLATAPQFGTSNASGSTYTPRQNNASRPANTASTSGQSYRTPTTAQQNAVREVSPGVYKFNDLASAWDEHINRLRNDSGYMKDTVAADNPYRMYAAPEAGAGPTVHGEAPPTQVVNTTTDRNGNVTHYYADGTTRSGTIGNYRNDPTFANSTGGGGNYNSGGGNYGTGGTNTRTPGDEYIDTAPPPGGSGNRAYRPMDELGAKRWNQGDTAFIPRENEVQRAQDRFIGGADWANQILYDRYRDLAGQMEGLQQNRNASRDKYFGSAVDMFDQGLGDRSRSNLDLARGELTGRYDTEGGGARSDFWNNLLESGGVDADMVRRATAAPIRAGYDNIQSDVRNAQRIHGATPNAAAAAAAIGRNRISDLGRAGLESELALAEMQNQNRFRAVEGLMGEDLRGDQLAGQVANLYGTQGAMEEDARARALSHLGAASGMDRDTWNIVNNSILGTTGQYSDNEARLAQFRNQAANNMYGPLNQEQPGIWERMLAGLVGNTGSQAVGAALGKL